jgi:hypothetical protein
VNPEFVGAHDVTGAQQRRHRRAHARDGHRARVDRQRPRRSDACSSRPHARVQQPNLRVAQHRLLDAQRGEQQ